MSNNLFCFYNGDLLPKHKVNVNITDLALIRGYGVFDFLRTYNRQPFRMNDYLLRFENSCREMNLVLNYSRADLIGIVERVLAANSHLDEAGIRFLMTGGESFDGYTIAQPNFFVLAEEVPSYPEWNYTHGIVLHTWEHQRELPKVKTINYLTAVKLAGERNKWQAQDTLYHAQNKILECTRNNFFLFHHNILVTSSAGMLEGITRKTVLELADGLFELEVRDVRTEELYECTECFISGSTRGVCPVAQINGHKIGSGAPGINTLKLMKKWKEFTLGNKY